MQISIILILSHIYVKSPDSLVFKRKINNIMTYIKLKIETKEEEIVDCLSFHKIIRWDVKK